MSTEVPDECPFCGCPQMSSRRFRCGTRVCRDDPDMYECSDRCTIAGLSSLCLAAMNQLKTLVAAANTPEFPFELARAKETIDRLSSDCEASS